MVELGSDGSFAANECRHGKNVAGGIIRSRFAATARPVNSDAVAINWLPR